MKSFSGSSAWFNNRLIYAADFRHFVLQGKPYYPSFLQMLPCCHLASFFLLGATLLLLFPTHITPPYCFHSNAITEMTVFSCCYHSSQSSVHIWRLSSSQKRCSLQQIANCSAGSVGVCAYYIVQV